MTDNLAARVALRALHLGYGVRPSHVGSLAGHIRMALAHRDAIADSDIDALLPTLAKSHRSHFVTDPAMTAAAKLDFANERLAKREEVTRPDGKIELTAKEAKRLDTLSAAQKLDLANEKTAAAMDAAKKTMKESA